MNILGIWLILWVGGAEHFAAFHHVSTKENWTEEEFQAASRKFSSNSEARDTYLEDFLNFSHERSRRAFENSRNTNQFTFTIQSFNPNIVIGGGNTPQVRGYDSSIFQTLATTLADQKAGLNTLNEAFGGRFMTEEDFEMRLHVLHQQFNEAINSLADIFASFADNLGLNASQTRSNVLQIGDIIRDHIWAGGSADDIRGTLNSNGATSMLNGLDNLGQNWHRRFGR